jgi:hypothetical protein
VKRLARRRGPPVANVSVGRSTRRSWLQCPRMRPTSLARGVSAASATLLVLASIGAAPGSPASARSSAAGAASARQLPLFFSAIAVACPAPDQCTVFFGNGASRVATFNPHHPGNPRSVRLAIGGPAGLACPSPTECVVVGPASTALTDSVETTFDPQHPAKRATAAVLPAQASFIAASSGTPVGLSCPSTTECVALDGYAGYLGAVMFNPRRPSRPADAKETELVPANFGSCRCEQVDTLTAVACPSSSQCSAVDEFYGEEITFDPRRSRILGRRVLDPGNARRSIAPGSLFAVACTTTSECTALDADGFEITVDPRTGHVFTHRNVVAGGMDPGILGIACPGRHQCTALRGGAEGTFDPFRPAPVIGAQLTANSQSSVACPSIVQCTAVGIDGEVTFNPQHPQQVS